jgi:outer membrane protein assembly factor BamB
MIGFGASPVIAQAASESWAGLQGDAAHSGIAADAAQPALRAAWRAAPAGDGRLSMPVVVAGVAIAVGRTSVVGIDPTSGSVEWTIPKGEGPPIAPAQASAGGGDVVVYGEGQGATDSAVVAIDPATHRRLWRVALGGQSEGIAVALGGVFVGARDGFVYRLEPSTGRVEWRVRAGAPVAGPVAVGPNQVFSVAESADTGETFFTAFDPSTGRKLWSFSPPRFATGSSAPTVGGGMVFAGFGDGSVRAFDAATGEPRWQRRLRNPFSGLTSPALSGGSLLVADIGGGLYRLDARTGQVAWDFQFTGFVRWGSPLVAGPTVYLGLEEGNDGVVAGVRLSDGHLVWERRTPGGPVAALAPAGDVLLVASVGSTGGLRGYRHDPGAALLDVLSPTVLNPGVALLDFGAAFLVLTLALLALGRYVLRRSTVLGVEQPTVVDDEAED